MRVEVGLSKQDVPLERPDIIRVWLVVIMVEVERLGRVVWAAISLRFRQGYARSNTLPSKKSMFASAFVGFEAG